MTRYIWYFYRPCDRKFPNDLSVLKSPNPLRRFLQVHAGLLQRRIGASSGRRRRFIRPPQEVFERDVQTLKKAARRPDPHHDGVVYVRLQPNLALAVSSEGKPAGL